MVSSARLRSFENDLYNILDYDLPAYHQIVSVTAKPSYGNDVDLLVVVRIGAYAIPDKEGCMEVVDRYLTNIRYDYKEIDTVHYEIRFK